MWIPQRCASFNMLVALLVTWLLAVRSEPSDLLSGTFKFADIDTYYQMYDVLPETKGAQLVLFLHGAKFSSDNWVSLGTLKLLNSKGYRVAAIDMPGFGKTRYLPYVDNNMRAAFLKAAFEFFAKGDNITATGAVLVSPSMSGRWAIPFLDRYGMMLKGWVPVAPVGVPEWGGPWEDTHKRVKLMAVYGEDDIMREKADDLLRLFRSSQKVIIPGAKHACYIDQPEIFHRSLIPFIQQALFTPKREL